MKPRGLRRGNWSVAELERLRQLLPRRGVDAMAALLHRSPASVLRKALTLFKAKVHKGAWSPADDQLLREAWGALDLRVLVSALGRTAVEIKRRAELLRTRLRDGAWSRREIQLLKDLYGTRADADLEVTLSRPAAAITAMAAKCCLAKDKRFTAHVAAPPETRPAPGRRMPRWRADEVQRLRELYGDRDNLAVARELGRSVTSVANKANQLGLKKSPALLTDIGRTNVGLRYGRGDAAGEAASEA